MLFGICNAHFSTSAATLRTQNFTSKKVFKKDKQKFCKGHPIGAYSIMFNLFLTLRVTLTFSLKSKIQYHLESDLDL